MAPLIGRDANISVELEDLIKQVRLELLLMNAVSRRVVERTNGAKRAIRYASSNGINGHRKGEKQDLD